MINISTNRKENKSISCSQEGKISEIEKFVEFWEGIWEQKERNSNMTWMVEVKQQLSQNVNVVNKLVVINEELMKVVAKRKNWTALGIEAYKTSGGRNLSQRKKLQKGHIRD